MHSGRLWSISHGLSSSEVRPAFLASVTFYLAYSLRLDISVKIPEAEEENAGATPAPVPKAAKHSDSSTPSSSLWKAPQHTITSSTTAATAQAAALVQPAVAPESSSGPNPTGDSDAVVAAIPLTHSEAMEVDQAAQEIEEWVVYENLLRPLWAVVQAGLEELAPSMKSVRELVLPQYFCPYSPILNGANTLSEAHSSRRSWMSKLTPHLDTIVFDCYPPGNLFIKPLPLAEASSSPSAVLAFNTAFFHSLELTPDNLYVLVSSIRYPSNALIVCNLVALLLTRGGSSRVLINSNPDEARRFGSPRCLYLQVVI